MIATLRSAGPRWLVGLLFTALAAASCMGLVDSDAIDRLDAMLGDWRMRSAPVQRDPRVVIVDIDEASLARIGRFPWSRAVEARLVTQLTEHYGVATVGFDISFPEADTSSGYGVLAGLAARELAGVPGFAARVAQLKPALDYDGLFAAALRGQPVVLGFSVSDLQQKGVLPAPAFTLDSLNGRPVTAYAARGYEANVAVLQQAARGAGIFTALTDPDGRVRSSTLLQQIGSGFYPSLSLATVAVFLHARAIAPHFAQSRDELSAGELANGGLDRITLFTPAGARDIPVGEALTTTIEYRGRGGPAGGAFTYIPAWQVLQGTAPAALLKGAIVLVGTTAPGLNDLRATPVNAEYPGVEVHANLIKSLLDGHFKSRPDYALAIETGQVLLAGLALTLAFAALSPAWSIVLAAAALAAAAGGNLYLYHALDMVTNSAVLALLIGALFLFNLAWGYFFEVRKSRALVTRFGEYVAPELVAEMAANPHKYTMDGASRELSVLFADVRGFTTIAESLSPHILREYINLYLTAMSEDIRDTHQGTLDKYIGDAVMAFWGAPVPFADHASRAVASALLMQASAARLNTAFQARGWPALAIGIGINSGLMHVGDMGSRVRRAYTVMGDAVNLGARLEGITKVYGVGIAVSDSTRLAAPEFCYRELDRVRVKGKNEPVTIFEPLGLLTDASADALAMLARWEQALQLLRSRDWDGAAALLSSLPQDGPVSLYARRVAQFRAAPPPDDWDGVTTFDTK